MTTRKWSLYSTALAAFALSLAACSQPPGGGTQDKTITVNGLKDGDTVPGAISVSAQGPAGTTRVSFKLDTQLPVDDLTSPFQFSKGGLNPSPPAHTLYVVAFNNKDEEIATKTISFSSTGGSSQLGAATAAVIGSTLTASATLASGRAPDLVSFSIVPGPGNTSDIKVFDTKADDTAPYSVTFDLSGLNEGSYTLQAQAVNAENKVEGTPVSANFNKTGAAATKPGFFEEFGPSQYHNDGGVGDPASRGWLVQLDGSQDTYTWVPQTEDSWKASVVHATTIRNEDGPDSRYYRPLPGGVTLDDNDSFTWWVIVRVTGRSSEIDEWKVGRIGLVKLNNTIPSDVGGTQAINNNINSVSFELEAQYNYPVGIFGLVNLSQKDCHSTTRLDCSRRQSDKLPLDPSVSPTSTTNEMAGLNLWMYVKCTYDGVARTFECNGRNDETGVSLGATHAVKLAADEHFQVDAFAIHSSGRPTFNGETPTLDWEVGRLSFTILENK